jgi:D-amino-acid oxidase
VLINPCKVSIDPKVYLSHLFKELVTLGDTWKCTNLSHINEGIESDTDVLINCTGIGAKTLSGVEDSDVFAVKGQIVIMKMLQNL